MYTPKFLATTAIAIISVAVPVASSIQLAVSPNCGTLTGSPANVNAGLPPLSSIKTIVAFGDGYTDGGKHDGSPLQPAVLTPPNPSAGGRSSNGPVWVEYLAAAAAPNATLKDYAVTGAVVDINQWPGDNLPAVNDFVTQANLFISQPNRPDPSTTLYTVFFGIGDYQEAIGIVSTTGDTDLSNVAGNLIYTILSLTSSPTFAKNILIVDNYGQGNKSAVGEAWKQDVFTGTNSLHKLVNANVGFVDLAGLWSSILGSTPGAQAFGYTSVGSCLAGTTSMVGVCSNPGSTLYWTPGMPSTATQKLIASYVQQALTQCK